MDLAGMLEDSIKNQDRLHRMLERIIERSTASLDQTIREIDAGLPGSTSSTPGFRAQTNDTEIIEGILVVLPVGTTTATLTLGQDYVIPIQNTTTLLSPLKLVVKGQDRKLVYSPSNATLGSFVALWGCAAPGLVPGILHP